MPLTVAIASFFSLIFAIVAPARAENPAVYFKASPRFELLRPFADPVNLSVLVTRADGYPIDGAMARIRLDAPAPGRIFSTDFPMVEGTRLLEVTLPLVRGRAEWKYLFPIRGVYRLQVDVVQNDATIATDAFRFSVRENETKWFFLAFFLLMLFALGVIAGRIFSGPSAAATLMLITALTGANAVADAPGQPPTGFAESGLEVSSAVVGKLAHVQWHWPTAAAHDLARAVTLTITHLEKQKIMFAVERVPSRGEFSMDFEFVDGAEYRVDALAEALGLPAHRAVKLINVAGIEPPPAAAIPALLLFVAVIAAGLVTGRWSKRTRLDAE